MKRIAKYTDPRAWFRALFRVSLHQGSGAVLAVLGTNSAEQLAPQSLAGIGMNLKQAAAVFCVSAFLAALRFINQQTEETTIPFPIKPPPSL